MNGILYFSSTGNSLYIAKKLKEKFGGKLNYIPKYNGNGSEFDKLYLVTPIYSYGMPKCVYDLLPKFDKTKELFVIQNYGGMVAGADYLFYKYAIENGLNIKSVQTLKMPENFTLTFSVPKFYIKSTLNSADERIDKALTKLLSGEYVIPKKQKTRESKYLKNMNNWHLIGTDFSTNDKCVQCQKCISVCPVGNIYFENGKIKFGDKCVACLGCYHRCPNKAIVYKNKKKKSRYINPFIDENEIGKSDK